MKKLFRIVLILAILAAGLLGAGHIFLKWGLTPLAKSRLPLLERELNADLDFDQVALDLFEGSLTLNGLRVANPESSGESPYLRIARARAEIALDSLSECDPIRIEHLMLEGVHLSLVRDRAGELQLEVASERDGRTEPETDAESPIGTPAKQSAPSKISSHERGQDSSGQQKSCPEIVEEKIATNATCEESRRSLPESGGELEPPILVKTLDVDGVVEYSDQLAAPSYPPLLFNFNLHAENIASTPLKDRPWASFYLNGNFASISDETELMINGHSALCRDLERANFDLKMDLNSLGPDLLERFVESRYVSEQVFDIDAEIYSRQGVYEDSWIKLIDFVPPSELLQSSGISVSALNLTIPLKGTVRNSRLDWRAVLQKLVRRKLIEQAEKSGRELINRKLGGDEQAKAFAEGLMNIILGGNSSGSDKEGEQSGADSELETGEASSSSSDLDREELKGSTPEDARAPKNSPEGEVQAEELITSVLEAFEGTNETARGEDPREKVTRSIKNLLIKSLNK